MPMSQDLLGLGLPPNLSASLGNNPSTLTATGTTQATAASILGGSHMVEMTASGSDGIILPSAAMIGTPYFVYNSSGSTGKVYAPVGHYMNTSLNSSLSVTTLKLAMFIQYKKGYWASILTG